MEKIEQIIKEKAWEYHRKYKGQAHSWLLVHEDAIKEAAAKIAKQIEAIELSWADKVEYLTDAWHSRLAKQEAQLADKEMSIGVLKAAIEEWQLIADEYMAQLAGMRQLIEAHFDGFDTKEAALAWHKRADKVLSAAPEVLWAGEAAWQDDMDGLGKPGIIFPPFKERLTVLLSHQPLRNSDGEQVKVIVVRKRDDEKPKP